MVDLDELERITNLMDERGMQPESLTVYDAIQELRLAREVVEKSKAFISAPYDNFNEWVELEEALITYEQLKGKG